MLDIASPEAAAEALIPHIEREVARAFRRHLATEAVKPPAGMATLRAALALVLDTNAQLAHTAAA